MKEWIVANVLQSRTAWGAILVLIAGTIGFIAVAPGGLATAVAYCGFLSADLLTWTVINKVGDNIIAKNE
jgi:hypothetical protein